MACFKGPGMQAAMPQQGPLHGALNPCSQVVDTAAARRELDAALDLRGNFVWCALSACCAGCAAWQRACGLLPRLAAVLAAGAACAAFAPWAFTRSLTALGRFAGAHVGRPCPGSGNSVPCIDSHH